MLIVNLFDGNFTHTLDQCGYITSTYFTKPKDIIWNNKSMSWDGITVFTDGYIFDDIVNSVETRIKIAWLIEPRSIDPAMYENILKVQDRFDWILTFDKELLEILPNKTIKYVMGQSRVSDEDAKIYDKPYLTSMIASHKRMSEGHIFRHEIKDVLHGKHNFEMFGSGYRYFTDKCEALKDYCFSISVMNCKRDNYFTEILVDCFRTGTIPIFWGCPNIGEWFDEDGIITFDTIEELDTILSNLSYLDYLKRAKSIKRNFELAKNYLCTDDMLAKIFKEKFKV